MLHPDSERHPTGYKNMTTNMQKENVLSFLWSISRPAFPMLLLPVTVGFPKQVLLHPVVVLLGIEQLDNKLQPNARYSLQSTRPAQCGCDHTTY